MRRFSFPGDDFFQLRQQLSDAQNRFNTLQQSSQQDACKTAAEVASLRADLDAARRTAAEVGSLRLQLDAAQKTAAEAAPLRQALGAAQKSATEVASLRSNQLVAAHKTACEVVALRKDLDAATQIVRQTEGVDETSLTDLLGEVKDVMDGPDGWGSPQVDLAANARQHVAKFVVTCEALSTLLSEAGASDPRSVAERREECCAAATALLAHIPASAAGDDAIGIPAAAVRPPPSLISELADVAAAAKAAHTSAFASVADVVSKGENLTCPIAATVKAALAANNVCTAHVEAVRAKLHEARAAAAVPTPAISSEECERQREAAEHVLQADGPWAGDTGLRRRATALATVRELVEERATAQRTLRRKDKLLAVAKAHLDVFSDDDDGDHDGRKDAWAELRRAGSERADALPALLAAIAAVQEWATSGEGALALKAFPGDVELTAALAELFEVEFKAHTELPRTPGVRLDVEYPAGLVESPATLVFYADRVCAGRSVPVVLRRLRLSSPELVQEAQRQVQDAGRIAVGLQSCPDTAAGAPPVVKATRWFLAIGPGGGTADAWIEFPRAEFGSLAEALAAARKFSATAAAALCMRLSRAVAQMHAAGIRHGDLNPSNVVLWDDPASDVIRPGIIDLLDTAVVGATRTLRGATLEWLPPEATEAVLAGTKAYGTRELDCWQLGRICEAVLDAAAALPDQLSPVRAAAAALCVADPAARSTAATALLAMEKAVVGASSIAATPASLQWAMPPARWLCQRGAAPGVDFVSLDIVSDETAATLAGCASDVGRRVRAVYRLENLRLWHVYAAERARVAEEAQGAPWPQRLRVESDRFFAPPGPDGEAMLLHGAPERSLRLIAEGGLDPSYSGDRVGSMFGAATCLTPSWNKAANEYARGPGAGVFATCVAVGRVADCLATPRTVTREYRRPPDGHHSVLGDNGSPGVVVAVYRPSRMYPEYLVVFDD